MGRDLKALKEDGLRVVSTGRSDDGKMSGHFFYIKLTQEQIGELMEKLGVVRDPNLCQVDISPLNIRLIGQWDSVFKDEE